MPKWQKGQSGNPGGRKRGSPSGAKSNTTQAAPGRPPKYDPEFAEQAKKLCKLGATDADLADFFEVDTSTIWRWSGRYPEFCSAIKTGKKTADERVERSLYQRAVGYEFDAMKIFQYEGVPVKVPYREKLPPETVACIFWLKNRRPDQWRDKHDHEMTGKNGGPIQTENISDFDLSRRIIFALEMIAQAPKEEQTSETGDKT